MAKSYPTHPVGGDRDGVTKSSPLRHLFLVIRSRHGPSPLQGQVPILAHQRTICLLDSQLPFHQSCTGMHHPIPIRNLQIRRYTSPLPHPQLCVSVRFAHGIPPILLHHFCPVANPQLRLVTQFR
jgi:hypothetical protein